MILPYRDYQPQVGKGGWVAPNATLIGDAVLGEDVSLWFGVIVRGDVHRIDRQCAQPTRQLDGRHAQPARAEDRDRLPRTQPPLAQRMKRG